MATRHSDFSIFDRLGDTTHRLTLACLGLVGHSARSGGALLGELLKTGQAVGSRLTGGLDEGARTVAGGVIKQAEGFVEQRVTRLLNSFQVPTSRDVHELSDRVEQLNRRLSELTEKAESQKPARAVTKKRKTAARKTAARKTTARRAISKKKTARKKTVRRTATKKKTSRKKTVKRKPPIKRKTSAKKRLRRRS